MNKGLIMLILLASAACATTGSGPDKAKVSEGYYNKGLSYLQANDLANAMAEFHRSIETDPNNKQSYYALGLVYLRQEKLGESERYLKEAIDIDDRFSDAYNVLGVVYSRQKKWKEALRAYHTALENKLYATPHTTYINIGDMYMAQGDFVKAAEAYRESKRIASVDLTILRLGRALLEGGMFREAITELKEGVVMSPKNADMHFALGQAYLKNGEKQSALASFRQAAALSPATETGRTAQDYIATIERPQGK
jgi:Tfp pilus assembly protein PilF